MGERRLTFHPGNRLDVLAERLARTLADDPLPPDRDEIIVVQSQGMARWLALALASRHGVCAGTSTPFPQTFVHALAAALGDGPVAASHDESQFGRSALTWRIFGDMARWHDEPAFAPAARYIADDEDGRKRYQLARRLADLFDNYQMFRPQMLAAWERDPDALPDRLAAHAETAAWQARLWSRLVTSSDEASLAARLGALIERLASGDPAELAGRLPARVSVFGASTLPPVFLELLAALARTIPVTVYFVSPTAEYWADLRSAREVERLRDRVEASGADADDAHVEEGNPLLASLGRLGREFFLLLQDADRDGTAWQPLENVAPATQRMLHVVQRDVLELAPGDHPIAVETGDDSIVVDRCHSPMREMEVLRDRILDAFERDPELRPDDVLVLVTDIARYAPYIEAVFGAHEPGVPAIPYSIADRSPVEEASPIKAVLRVLEVAAGRFEAGDVIDLLELDIIRRRFGVRADELRHVREWIGATNIRWGIDAAWRESEIGIARMDANSWKFGIDRMLMGYAVGDCGTLVGGIAPSAAAALTDADLLGRFTGFTETLFAEQRVLRRPAMAADWARNVRRVCDVFLDPAPEDEAPLSALRAAVDDLAHHAERGGVDEALSPAVVRRWLTDSLTDDSKGSGFINGRVTFCALKPMRTIPFRIICVAGLDDRAFPRRDRPAGFDLMAAAPRPGDRSLRDDDRYLFLETLLAAGERLVLTYEGRSLTDVTERAPSVVLSELLDYLDRRFTTADGRSGVRSSVVVDQAMHPFDSRYFTAEPPRLFSYSSEYRSVAAASGDHTLRAPAPAEADLGPPEWIDVTPAELAEFWTNPSKAFAETVLGIRLRDDHAEEEDSEPFELDALQDYRLKQEMLERRLGYGRRDRPEVADDAAAGESEPAELSWMRACGELPIGGFGSAKHRTLAESVEKLAARIGSVEDTEVVPIDLVGNGWRLSGSIDEVVDAHRAHVRFRCAALKTGDYVRAWVLHVVACAAARERGVEPVARTLHGMDRSVALEPPDDARAILEDLMAGYLDGMSRPLPLFPQCAWELAKVGVSNEIDEATVARAIRKGWESELRRRGDEADPYIALCFRDLDPLARFDVELRMLVSRLWGPLLEHLKDLKKGGGK